MDRIPLYDPKGRGGDRSLILVQLHERLPVPFVEVLARPLQGLIEVAEVACIGAPTLQRNPSARTVDSVTAHRRK